MAWSASNNSIHCATCANWGGARTVKFNGSSVEVKHCDDKGKCYLNRGPFSSGPSASYSCNQFKKWSALK